MEDTDEIEQETLLVVDFVDSSDGLFEKLKDKPMKFSVSFYFNWFIIFIFEFIRI